MSEFIVDTLDYGEFTEFAEEFDDFWTAVQDANLKHEKDGQSYAVYLDEDCKTITIVAHGSIFHSEESKHYRRLLSDSLLLDCMHHFGVDEWEGYQDATDLHYQENDTSKIN